MLVHQQHSPLAKGVASKNVVFFQFILSQLLSQPWMSGTTEECIKAPFLQIKICLCHHLAGKQVSMIFLVFDRNGNQLKIEAWKVLFRLFDGETESSPTFITCKKNALDFCTYSLPQKWRAYLSHTPVLLGTLQRELRLAACERWENSQLFSVNVSLSLILQIHTWSSA